MLVYLGRLKGASYGDLNSRLETWLDRFDLLQWRHKKLESLSKGMSQKVQFISALLHDPDIIILDEPFSGLDPLSVEVLKEAVLEEASRGKTVLFSTHVMEQAEKICGKILLLNRGKALVNGALADIKRERGSNHVQIDFSGDVNLIKDSDQVGKLTVYPRYAEAEFSPGGSADGLLKELAGKLSIKRFEVKEPSLNSIFLSLCGDKGADHE